MHYKTKTFIIGAGKGGTALLQIFIDDPEVDIVGICDINSESPGIKLAKEKGIKTTDKHIDFIDKNEIDVVMNATGDEKITADIIKLQKKGLEVVGGIGAKLMWQVISERQKNELETQKLLTEYQSLYKLGLFLSSIESLHELFPAIVQHAIEVTNCPAGSLAIFKEGKGEMQLVAVEGFSDAFSRSTKWKVRQGGLTSDILNTRMPTIIPDISMHPKFDNPIMVDEGIKSIAASPLFAEGRIIGILYVDDFHIREFDSREISMLSLLSTLAALAIQRAELLDEARYLSITDELTKIYNHRYFMHQLRKEVSRAVRYNHSLSLAMFDIDHFKNYNDKNGHLKGNEVLRIVSQMLDDQSREGDIVARYGGEEFVIIMPETDKMGASALSERIKQSIADYVFENEEEQPADNLTISGGIATCPSDAFNANELIEKADKALYKAKESGRNKVELY